MKRLVLFVSLSAIEMLFMNLRLTTRLLSTFESERKTHSISKTITISKKVVPLLILLLLNPIFTFLCIYRLKGKKDASRPLTPLPSPLFPEPVSLLHFAAAPRPTQPCTLAPPSTDTHPIKFVMLLLLYFFCCAQLNALNGFNMSGMFFDHFILLHWFCNIVIFSRICWICPPCC